MPKIILHDEVQQGSDEWFKLRLGSIGGSKAYDLIAANGKGKMRQNILYDLASERITGQPTEHFKFRHADRGHEYEPEARAFYEYKRNVTVDLVAIILSDTHGLHFSPDGMVGRTGITEFKVRLPSVYLELYANRKFDLKDMTQCQHAYFVYPELEWVDYVNYCPEIPDLDKRGFITRIERDDEVQKKLKECSELFFKDLDKLVRRMG